jgi:serine/threonine protein kinase
VRHQIGRGSFGSAFLVTNKQDKAEYVLKRVRLAKQTPWQRNSTLQERKLVRQGAASLSSLSSCSSQWPRHHEPASSC